MSTHTSPEQIRFRREDTVPYPETTQELLMENLTIAEVLLRVVEVDTDSDPTLRRIAEGSAIKANFGEAAMKEVQKIVPFHLKRIRHVLNELKRGEFVVVPSDTYRLRITPDGRHLLSDLKAYFSVPVAGN